ncbi:galactokinase [Gracilinema caldarium]|uniref:Galactokinase n=1 Tax=Gracilinema caldarium (strain ATCC 51460 / DSM 7334 / H1) TaxID=744872 RepID=F8EYP0_GRAC1|nr:galactokinase family protein [Gracilinema caldarium]AEJ18617.1 Galactokinase [Gracilinema caldarium DSM 7334]
MTGHELLHRLSKASSRDILAELYGTSQVDEALMRYRALLEATLQAFPESEGDIHVFTAAGRTELGGNHTDHNHGKVLAASIQLDALAFVAPRQDTKVIFRSTGYPDVVLDIADTTSKTEERGTTAALIRGIAAEFKKRGVAVRGFTANAHNTVLSGSGLSSSASVEVLFGTIFDRLYGEGKRSAVEIAQIGQKAENEYFGKPCGLMDQVACASGGAVAIDFKDPAQPIVTQVPFDPSLSGYALCVVDTGGSHADLTDEYAAVPTEMKAVAAHFGKTVLRDISKDDLRKAIPDLRRSVGDRAILRALHFLAENDRVDAMLRAITANHTARTATERQTTIETFLYLVNESGNSSWELLQNVFSVKSVKEQGPSLALAMTREFIRNLGRGACRVHGGGFAGTIQVYIPLESVHDYRVWMAPTFGEKAVTQLRIRPIGASELHFE